VKEERKREALKQVRNRSIITDLRFIRIKEMPIKRLEIK
jgi:hypothetical protein